ncbi:MAG: antiterminator LoaP [Clostridiaceae bacterium]|nr:antiterminator LoaP [Clostridiaceae bacterium]
MYWYVLFVRTVQEFKVEQLLKERLDSDLFMPFVPLREIFFKKAGIMKKELKPLFPGYVFVESELSNREFIKKVRTLIYNSRSIFSLLKYSDTEFAMRESEKQMLLILCNDDRCIESSKGISEGNKIYITDGPLKGRESIVKKVDRHKRRAEIELEIMGDIRCISVSLEIINKVPLGFR